jgi:hypothetical protein
MGIDFAHRTFSWSNDAQGQAAVHVVIVGFSGNKSRKKKALWDYPDIKGQPVLREVPNINAYLLAAQDILITSRAKPLRSDIPRMDYGNKPTDGGYLSDISPEEAAEIRKADPVAAKYLRRIIGARELIQGVERWCLWLHNADPGDIRSSAVLSHRVAEVREYRSASTKAKTREDAMRPHEFQEIRAPKSNYVAVPRVSSSTRDYVPMAWFGPDVITNDALFIIPDAPLWLFGIVSARPINVWNKAVSGRLKSDTRLSAGITYNNYPFPIVDAEAEEKLGAAAQKILVVRQQFATSTLADLYDPNAMPTDLRKAHQALDKIVLSMYGLTPAATDERILEVLFERYLEATEGLVYQAPKKRKAKAASE